MPQKLSIRQRIICGVIAFCAAALYFCFFAYVISSAWGRKEGDLPPVSSRVEGAGDFLAFFPFGYIPGLNNFFKIAALNGLFWSALSGMIYIYFVRRKAGNQQGRPA